MAKIYIKNAIPLAKMRPKKETISFLLQFSKSLSYVEVNGKKVEISLN